MRLLTRVALIGLIITGTLFPVMAAVAPENEPPGNTGMWLFLGFCSVIIVAQLLPLWFSASRNEQRGENNPAEQTKEVTGR